MQKIYKILPIILLTACSVGPDYERPQFWADEELQKTLNLKSNNYALDKEWYKMFGDETLNNLAVEAKNNNLNIKVALSRLRQARYNLDIARVTYFPMVDVESDYNYAYAQKYQEFGNKNDYFHVGFDASWEIDIWGKGRRTTESSVALYKATSANMENVLVTVTSEVINDYVMLKTEQSRLQNARNNLRLQQDILQNVKDKYKSGLVGEEDLYQADFAVQNTKALIPDLEKTAENYKNAINVLLGKLPDDKLLNKDMSAIKSVFRFDIEKIREFPLEALRNRPDVREAEEMLKSKNANIGKAIAAMFPNISLNAALGRQGHSIKSLNYAKNAAYGYNPEVSMPFLHWGQLLNEVKLSKEIKEEYLYTYQEVLLNAINEVKNAINAVEKEYEKNEALQKAEADMKNVLKTMKIKYNEGLIEFSDLLISERNLLSAQDDLINSNGNICQNIVVFHKAVGGGY